MLFIVVTGGAFIVVEHNIAGIGLIAKIAHFFVAVAVVHFLAIGCAAKGADVPMLLFIFAGVVIPLVAAGFLRRCAHYAKHSAQQKKDAGKKRDSLHDFPLQEMVFFIIYSLQKDK
jgi:hypothetical protein